jgi:hypothetical protein
MDLNPFTALADFVLGKMRQSMLALWLKLIFTMVFSATVTFLFICGGTLVATHSWTIAIGSGMVMAALVLTVCFRRSPLTKGMMIVLPAGEAAEELAKDFQVIQKS